MIVLKLFRPAAVALGLFVALNAGATCAQPSLGAGRLLINLPIPEPYLSLSLVAFALCLLFPTKRPGLRPIQAGALGIFGAAAFANIVRYYLLLGQRLIQTPLPVPFSVVILAVIVAAILELYWAPNPGRLPLPLHILLDPVAFFLLVAIHIVTFGHTDYRGFRRPGEIPVAIVLGARVYDDGRVSDALRYRLLTGIELWHEGTVEALIMTGGAAAEGAPNEAEVMAAFAVERGVPPAAILIDRSGVNTFASARNCAALCAPREWYRAIVVSQYYHLARTKLIFERQGLNVLTVPAKVGGEIRKNLSLLLRETAALPYYYLSCTFEKRPSE